MPTTTRVFDRTSPVPLPKSASSLGAPALAALLLVLGACGGSGSMDETSSESASSSGASGTENSGSQSGSGPGGDTDGTTDGGDPGDTDGDDGSGASDGSRLQLHWFRPDSGPEQLTGIFDTELGIVCSFRTAADGALRCLPTTEANRVHFDAATE